MKRLVKVADLKPGMGTWDERLNRRIEVTAVKAKEDVVLVWVSNGGRDPVPFPCDPDDEFLVDCEAVPS